MSGAIKIVECPRDAMQGYSRIIPSSEKIKYLESLLDCGFDTLDCGSFVSHAAVPQMADTAEVLHAIEDKKGDNHFLVIVANERGARDASGFNCVDDVGFPFSINETFQLRNTNKNIKESHETFKRISEICDTHGKRPVIYLSMAFGNPYNDHYDRNEVIQWAETFANSGVEIISLADTTGTAHTEDVDYLFRYLIPRYPNVEFGAHFHARPDSWHTNVDAAYSAGCRRFDGALKGFGGCPFAKDDLTGNIPTEEMMHWLSLQNQIKIDENALQKAMLIASEIFS